MSGKINEWKERKGEQKIEFFKLNNCRRDFAIDLDVVVELEESEP